MDIALTVIGGLEVTWLNQIELYPARATIDELYPARDTTACDQNVNEVAWRFAQHGSLVWSSEMEPEVKRRFSTLF